MKYIFLLIFSFFWIFGYAQFSERQQHRIDSVYNIAIDSSKAPEARLKAYNRCCWATVYKDYNLGLRYSSEYLDLASTHKVYDRIALASHFKGYAEMMLGDLDTADNTYQEGLEAAIKSEIPKYIADLYGDLGNLRNHTGHTDEAITFHKKCLALADQHDLQIQQARARINLGEIHEAQGKYKQSLEIFQEALAICIKYEFNGFMSSIYQHIGDINLTIKEFKTAEKNYRQALQMARKMQNSLREMQALKKLGRLNQELSQMDDAIEYYENALAITTIKETPLLEAQLMTDLASARLNQGQSQEALENITKSIELFEQHGIEESLDETYLIAAQIYQAINQNRESRRYYQKSYSIAEQNGNVNSLQMASLGLARLSESNNDQSTSLKYYKDYMKYDGLKRNEDQVKEIIRMDLKSTYRDKSIVDSLTKEKEIQVLKAEHDQKQAKSKYRTYQALAGIGILSLALLFIAYFFVQKRKTAIILNEKNQVIGQALADKDVLLKEVHHRVKNNMQVVSSLLQLKSINAGDKTAKAALIDSKKRIDSMQLAHQKMYQDENYEQIDIVEYARDIVGLLLDSIETAKDTFEVNGEVLFVHVEQAQALGFIIHELITNSIKHAWEENQPKQIILNFAKKNNEIQFEYQDNGKGLSSSFDLKTSKSLGMSLIHSIATRQLLGQMRMNNSNGFHLNIKFNERE